MTTIRQQHNRQKQQKRNRQTYKRPRRHVPRIGGYQLSNEIGELSCANITINCQICENKIYEKVVSTIGKSKMRTGAVGMLFGNSVATETLNNTSVDMYICQKCGNCRVVRNVAPFKQLWKIKPQQGQQLPQPQQKEQKEQPQQLLPPQPPQ